MKNMEDKTMKEQFTQTLQEVIEEECCGGEDFCASAECMAQFIAMTYQKLDMHRSYWNPFKSLESILRNEDEVDDDDDEE